MMVGTDQDDATHGTFMIVCGTITATINRNEIVLVSSTDEVTTSAKEFLETKGQELVIEIERQIMVEDPSVFIERTKFAKPENIVVHEKHLPVPSVHRRLSKLMRRHNR
jgi:hypothetical protein